MNVRQAEQLLTVLEERSVSRAASRLGVSQPAISQTIQSAEKEIGMKIFQRGAEDSFLTYAGEQAESGVGVFTINGQMIDIAMLEGAQRTLDLARASGIYKGDLR